MRMDDVEIISMLTSAAASVSNMVAATPGFVFMPAPTRLTRAMSSSKVTPAAPMSVPRASVVAGFQGVSTTRDVTTLGRGGSDTTAVALAAALGALACEIYTDVTGVFTADPRVVSSARRLPLLSFEELLEMTAAGCPKPEMRAAEFARNHKVPLHIRSSFTWEPGTRVREEDESMEQAIVSAITHETAEAKVTVAGVPDRPGIAATMFEVLAKDGINIEMISTSPIRISCVVRADRAEDAVQSLHTAFELEGTPS